MIAGMFAPSILWVATAAADGQLGPQQRENARATLEIIRDLPDATERETLAEGRVAALDEAFRSLSELAESVTQPIRSDGSLEAELVLVGRDLSRDDSAVRRLWTKLSAPPEEFVDPEEVPSFRDPTMTRATLLERAFTLTWDEATQLDGEERHESRLAWQAALLMPEMLGESATDARTGRAIAFDALIKIRDPASIPVIVERMAIDLEHFGWSARLPVHMQTACIGVARLAISDGAVSQVDLQHLLALIGFAEASEADETYTSQLIDSLVREFSLGGFVPLRAPTVQDGVGVVFEEPSRDEHMIFFRQWAGALDAYPREDLSKAQRGLVESMLEAAKSRLSE